MKEKTWKILLIVLAVLLATSIFLNGWLLNAKYRQSVPVNAIPIDWFCWDQQCLDSTDEGMNPCLEECDKCISENKCRDGVFGVKPPCAFEHCGKIGEKYRRK